MATKKPKSSPPKPAAPQATALDAIGTVLSTFSGPSTARLDQSQADTLATDAQRRLATQKVGAQLGASVSACD